MKAVATVLACLMSMVASPWAGAKEPAGLATKIGLRVREACSADLQKFCADHRHNPLRLPACMRAHAPQLQPACRNALQDAGKIPLDDASKKSP